MTGALESPGIENLGRGADFSPLLIPLSLTIIYRSSYIIHEFVAKNQRYSVHQFLIHTTIFWQSWKRKCKNSFVRGVSKSSCNSFQWNYYVTKFMPFDSGQNSPQFDTTSLESYWLAHQKESCKVANFPSKSFRCFSKRHFCFILWALLTNSTSYCSQKGLEAMCGCFSHILLSNHGVFDAWSKASTAKRRACDSFVCSAHVSARGRLAPAYKMTSAAHPYRFVCVSLRIHLQL